MIWCSNSKVCLTAVGRLIGSIHTVVVPVTHPHPGDAAFGDRTLELVGGTCHFRCTTDTQLPLLHRRSVEKTVSTAVHYVKPRGLSCSCSLAVKGAKMTILTSAQLFTVNAIPRCGG